MLIVAVTLMLLGIAWLRERARATAALHASDAALAMGDFNAATEAAREAAMCRTFGAAAPRMGFERLDSFARSAASRGDLVQMKAALIAMRSAADATDDDAWRTSANEALARCAALIAATPAARAVEGCNGEGDASCLRAMNLELGAPTHPSGSAHAWLIAAALALAAAAIVATRKREAAT
jgi:hypothetical protein